VVRQGLNNASGYFRQAIARRLRMKVAPAVKFEVDTVFEQAERVEKLLREDAAARAAAPAAAASDAPSHDDAMTATPKDDPIPSPAKRERVGRGGRRRAGPRRRARRRQAAGPDVVRCRAARAACGRRAAGRARRHAGSGGVGRVAGLPGEATKLAQFLLDADKQYDFTVCFGVETDTDDAEGTVTGRRDASAVDEAGVRLALEPFRGPITQVPPNYSALKRAGRPCTTTRGPARRSRPRRAAWSSTSWS
jgi:hypothetical protein